MEVEKFLQSTKIQIEENFIKIKEDFRVSSVLTKSPITLYDRNQAFEQITKWMVTAYFTRPIPKQNCLMATQSSPGGGKSRLLDVLSTPTKWLKEETVRKTIASIPPSDISEEFSKKDLESKVNDFMQKFSKDRYVMVNISYNGEQRLMDNDKVYHEQMFALRVLHS